MKRNECGAVTIEATICLTAFMFAIVSLLTAIDICLAQARISTAIDATAKEISQYSYLYGLTGFNSVKKNLKNGGADTQDKIEGSIEGINNVFNAIQDLGNTGKSTNIADPSSVTATWESLKEDGGKIKASAEGMKTIAESIKEDPKSFIFGIAKLGASDLIDIGISKLIAEPIAMAMVQKHLKNYDDQDPEAFLRGLRVVPDASGSYLGGLDFSESSLFMHGSDEIRIVVSYKIKIIPLLPIKAEFNFRQTAVTKGWLGGDSIPSKFQDDAVGKALTAENKENKSIWTEADVETRSSYIRTEELKKEKGFYKIKNKRDHVQAYNPVNNEFLGIVTSNLLYSEDPSKPKKVSDITDAEIEQMLDNACYSMSAEIENLNSVTYLENNQKKTATVEKGYTKTLKLIIPQDEGLDKRIQEYINNGYDSNNVKIVVITGYGNGASSTEVAVNTAK